MKNTRDIIKAKPIINLRNDIIVIDEVTNITNKKWIKWARTPSSYKISIPLRS